ncbi:MAG TPA: outer membrane beta-barrel protein [Gemmatimonadales bacterium]
MLRISLSRPLTAVGLALGLCASIAQAQLVEVHNTRFEFTPFAGYQWGGSLETDAVASLPSGSLRIPGSFAWGGILSFRTSPGSAVELTYLRQDSDLNFDPLGSGPTLEGLGLSVNYIQAGGLYEFMTDRPFRPFLTGSLGIGIFDAKGEDFGSDTRFSWTVGTGFKYMFKSGRIGIRSDLRLWVTPFPSGDYATWCDFYGCFVAEGTEWVTQGTASGGLIFAF